MSRRTKGDLLTSYLGREEDPAGDAPGKVRVGTDVVFPVAFCASAALAPFVFFLSISRLTGSRSLIGGFLAEPVFDAIVTLQIKTSYVHWWQKGQ